jgi:hypothetical protein
LLLVARLVSLASGLGADADERAIESAIVEHITRFLLELGAGFAYVGRQVPIEVGGDDFFIDLLFYHLKLRCYVVIELKAGSFKPEHAGQLNFYLSAVDAQGEGGTGPSDHRAAAVDSRGTYDARSAEFRRRSTLSIDTSVWRHTLLAIEHVPRLFFGYPIPTPALPLKGREEDSNTARTEKILNARVYDVAIETPLELAPNLSARSGNTHAAQARGHAAGVLLQAARRLQQDGPPDPGAVASAA